jgi:hypothetical protein
MLAVGVTTGGIGVGIGLVPPPVVLPGIVPHFSEKVLSCQFVVVKSKTKFLGVPPGLVPPCIGATQN